MILILSSFDQDEYVFEKFFILATSLACLCRTISSHLPPYWLDKPRSRNQASLPSHMSMSQILKRK